MQPVKEATPDENVVGEVEQVKPPPEGVRVTADVELEVTVLPLASSRLTAMGNEVPADVVAGGAVTKMSLVAGPAVKVMAFELAPVREVEAALMVNEPAVPVSEQPLKVATPDEAERVRPPVLVHDRVPELLTDRVTLAAELATVLPPES